MTRRNRVLVATGIATLALLAAAAGLQAALPRDRTISLHNIHSKETITVQYMKDGKRIPDAIEKINWVLRDWRRNEPTKMDPDLVDLLWELNEELGGQEPIHIISGFRSRATNEMLRKTVGGQASESRHILGKAADVYFPGVELKKLRYSALLRERGGVGYYPTSGTPFVHVDTDRVRAWPRLPRFELALLFPSAKTQHLPADGGPITVEDARVAKARHPDVATRIAEFISGRRTPGQGVAVAEAPSKPNVVEPAKVAVAAPAAPVQPARTAALVAQPAEPAVIDRSSKLVPRPSAADSRKLGELVASAVNVSFKDPELVQGPKPAARNRGTQPVLPSLNQQPAPLPAAAAAPAEPPARMAAIAPGTASGTGQTMTDATLGSGWVQAPAYDDEHPEELSYRPFPIAPYLTASASPDDPALVTLVHPNVGRTLELIDIASGMPRMTLRPGAQEAAILWAQQFQGPAVKPDPMAAKPTAPAPIADRKVRTTAGG